MGKKSRAKRSSQPKRTNQVPAVETPKQVVPASLGGEAPALSGQSARPAHALKATVMDIQGEYVRGDILRIVMLVLIVAVLVASCSVVASQTSYLSQAGARLASFLRLQ